MRDDKLLAFHAKLDELEQQIRAAWSAPHRADLERPPSAQRFNPKLESLSADGQPPSFLGRLFGGLFRSRLP